MVLNKYEKQVNNWDKLSPNSKQDLNASSIENAQRVTLSHIYTVRSSISQKGSLVLFNTYILYIMYV